MKRGIFINSLNETHVNTSGIPELLSPGFKILHIPDVDYMTNYYTFKDALIHIENWSDVHPEHFPVFIMIELKTESLKDALPASIFTSTLPFTKNALDSIDLEIKQIFGDGLSKVITPDNIRGKFATINEALKNGNWPTIGEARGKVCFILMTVATPAACGRVTRFSFQEVIPR